MTKKSMTKGWLANRLDDVLPPNTDLILNEDASEASVQAAVVLARQGQRQISAAGHDWAYERMVAAVDDLMAQDHFKPRRNIPYTRLVASILIVLLAGLLVAGFLGGGGPMVNALGDPIPAAAETEEAVEEPEVIPSDTPTATPTETFTATATFTDVPSATPSNTPVPPLAEPAYVGADDGAPLYTEPSTTANIIATLARGDAVTILGYDATQAWALVQSTNELAGWIQSTLLSDTVPPLLIEPQQEQAAPQPQPQQQAPAPAAPQNDNPPPPPNNNGGGGNGGGNGGPGGGNGGNGGPGGGGGNGGPGGGGGNGGPGPGGGGNGGGGRGGNGGGPGGDGN
jgi:uncharacterized membrane protein YgcG